MYTTPGNTDTVTTLEFTGQGIHTVASTIFATIGSVMILSGFFGNWLLIAVVFKQYQSKRCVHNLFIVNLALADMLTLVYWFTFFVLDLILGYHPIVDNAHCVVNGVIICTLCVVSTSKARLYRERIICQISSLEVILACAVDLPSFTNPLTMGVVGAPQRTSKPVSPILFSSPLASGT